MKKIDDQPVGMLICRNFDDEITGYVNLPFMEYVIINRKLHYLTFRHNAEDLTFDDVAYVEVNVDDWFSRYFELSIEVIGSEEIMIKCNCLECLDNILKEISNKPFLKIIDDYFIKYGDEGELFSMHKPSDIRSLMHILNRERGYDELTCEYNGELNVR